MLHDFVLSQAEPTACTCIGYIPLVPALRAFVYNTAAATMAHNSLSGQLSRALQCHLANLAFVCAVVLLPVVQAARNSGWTSSTT